MRQMPGAIDKDNSGLLGRPDMFDSPFKSPGATRGSSFNTNHPLYRLQRLYADVRKTYEPLSQGMPQERWADPNGSGVYVESRLHDGKEVVVVYNTSGQPRSVSNVAIDRDAWEKSIGTSSAARTARLVERFPRATALRSLPSATRRPTRARSSRTSRFRRTAFASS